jgi:hypothetical protein
MAFEHAFQRMPTPALAVHIQRVRRQVEGRRLDSQPAFMARLNTGFRTGEEELLDTSMPKALNH